MEFTFYIEMEGFMKNEVCNLLKDYLKNLDIDEIKNLLEIPPKIELGDYSFPCFSLAKKFHKSPNIIADELKRDLEKSIDKNLIEKVDTAGGYLNLFINKDYYINKVLKNALDDNYGESHVGVGKTICIDYSSPNIAKNFHVGHLRTTVIGNSLYKIFSKQGYNVVRINHLGDWGTQFGKLIVAYKNWSSKKLVEKNGIEELLRIYVKFHDELENTPELIDEARAWFVKMENKDEEALELWKCFYDISIVEFNRIYKLLDVDFDYYTGESFYINMLQAVVNELEEKNLLMQSQGAKIIDLDQYGMPPCLIIKSDGNSIYAVRDIATILYRKNTFNFDKCIYVTGMEQKLYFSQIFKVIDLMGYDFYNNLIHISYGLVNFDGAKLSTRSGNIVYAEDILNEAINRAAMTIKEKNFIFSDKEEVAKSVGVGAIIFNDLINTMIKSVDFTWDRVLNYNGATGPYVQYTCARAKSILRKSDININNINFNAINLKDTSSYELIKLIAQYPDTISEAANKYEPHLIARYALLLSQTFNKFYHECSIINADDEVKNSRLILTYITQKIISDAMNLLGIKCPEEM